MVAIGSLPCAGEGRHVGGAVESRSLDSAGRNGCLAMTIVLRTDL